MESTITAIARIHNAYDSKFGIPRQSNIIGGLESLIVFEPAFRSADALRGIEGFDYLWLLWQFSENVASGWSPTVRPPRLGGNERRGVFATRSSFRPNALALSSVRLLRVEWEAEEGPLLVVGGADLMEGSPIFDIKPYLPYTDSHPEARSGFAPTPADHLLEVRFPDALLQKIPQGLRQPLTELLAHDPRPSYHHDPARLYGFPFGGFEVRFRVPQESVLEVVDVLNKI